MPKEFPFDPSQVTYAQRFTRGSKDSKTKKDGTLRKKSGPYWYANWMEFGRLRTFYIGKVLPDECKPYAPTTTYIDNPNPNKTGRIPTPKRGASDSILEALDRGEQVIIDIPKLAEDCKAQYTSIGSGRYLIYRDP